MRPKLLVFSTQDKYRPPEILILRDLPLVFLTLCSLISNFSPYLSYFLLLLHLCFLPIINCLFLTCLFETFFFILNLEYIVLFLYSNANVLLYKRFIRAHTNTSRLHYVGSGLILCCHCIAVSFFLFFPGIIWVLHSLVINKNLRFPSFFHHF